MAVIAINDVAIIGGCITLPQRGAWTADLAVAVGEEFDGDVEISNANGTLVLQGYAYRATVYGGTLTIRVVGGKGGLRNVIAARGYQVVPALQVAQEIAADCGEAIAADSAAVLGDVLTHWARPKGTAERALTLLADQLGLVWRVNADGEILFVADTFADVDTDGVPLNYDAGDGQIDLGVDDFDGALGPGSSYDGSNVYCVVHHIGQALRTTLHFDGDGDRIRGTLRKIVESSLPSYALRAFYAGRMVSQSGSNVDFIPDADDVPGMQRVPLMLGVPGLSIQAAPGARMGMGYYGGDPTKPYAGMFESGSLLSYTLTCPNITLGTSAALPIALAPPTIGGFAAIATYIAALTSALAANPSSYTPFAAAMAAPGAAVAAALGGLAATVPSLTTKAT